MPPATTIPKNGRVNPASKSEAPLKTRLREASRRAILEAAEELLAEKGPHGARMEDVAARAGVSVGTVYNHVGDRQALLGALLVAQRDELLGRIDAVLEGANEAPFAETVEGFVRAVLAHFDAHLSLFRLLIEDELAQGRRDGKRSAMRMVAERAERLVGMGVAQGAVRTEDAELYPALLIGMMRGVLAQSLVRASEAPLVDLAPAAARFFVRGAGSDSR